MNDIHSIQKIYSEKLINDIRKIIEIKILIHDNHKYRIVNNILNFR